MVVEPGTRIRARNVAQASPNDIVRIRVQYDSSRGNRNVLGS